MESRPKVGVAGQIVHDTRRTTQRQFLLKNDEKDLAKNEFGNLFGLTALRHNQTPHAPNGSALGVHS